jgi:hypothetical protein
MVKCAFDFTGNFETMITPTSIGNDAREDLASCFFLVFRVFFQSRRERYRSATASSHEERRLQPKTFTET